MLTTAFTKDGLAPDPLVLNPRSFIKLSTKLDGEDVETGIQPTHMSHHRASHNKADEAKISIDSNGFDFPIRKVEGAMLTLYYGGVEEASDDVATRDNVRFPGVVVDYEIDHQGRVASFEAQDLSYLCRRKTYPVRKTIIEDADGRPIGTVDPTPHYSDTLKKAIERLLSMLPEFQAGPAALYNPLANPAAFRDGVSPPLVLRDTDALRNASLSKLVNGRASRAPIALRPDCTVWEAIEHLCGLVGCHVKVDLNEIVVRTSEEVFGGRSSKCTFIFGSERGNCFGPKFHKKPQANRNGVRVICIDPETKLPKTAIWPTEAVMQKIQHKQPKHQKAAPKKPSNKPKPAPDAKPRDIYELDPCHYTDDGLLDKAKAIWLERSRHEADGTVATPIWTKEILELSNADLITVKVDADIAQQISRIGDDAAASQLLQEMKGYDKAAADALVHAAREPSSDDWYTRSVTFEHPSEHLATVEFINLVEI